MKYKTSNWFKIKYIPLIFLPMVKVIVVFNLKKKLKEYTKAVKSNILEKIHPSVLHQEQ